VPLQQRLRLLGVRVGSLMPRSDYQLWRQQEAPLPPVQTTMDLA
jgi:hypothetical protein